MEVLQKMKRHWRETENDPMPVLCSHSNIVSGSIPGPQTHGGGGGGGGVTYPGLTICGSYWLCLQSTLATPQWCMYSGGVCTVVVCVQWWCMYSGGVYTVVVYVQWWCIQWWYMYSGGVCIQWWYMYSGGVCTVVVYVQWWCMYTVVVYVQW